MGSPGTASEPVPSCRRSVRLPAQPRPRSIRPVFRLGCSYSDSTPVPNERFPCGFMPACFHTLSETPHVYRLPSLTGETSQPQSLHGHMIAREFHRSCFGINGLPRGRGPNRYSVPNLMPQYEIAGAKGGFVADHDRAVNIGDHGVRICTPEDWFDDGLHGAKQFRLRLIHAVNDEHAPRIGMVELERRER